jgi:phosphoglucosamine mutase
MPWARCCAACHEPTVLIGKDTRISGYMLESALEAGFASAGVDVLLTGPLPTPGVAYLTRAAAGPGRGDQRVAQPLADNGIKFFSARAKSCPTPGRRRSKPR